jgi:hypothetical protein
MHTYIHTGKDTALSLRAIKETLVQSKVMKEAPLVQSKVMKEAPLVQSKVMKEAPV